MTNAMKYRPGTKEPFTRRRSSKQEKWLADILERNEEDQALGVPRQQMPIFYADGDYNPDFIADDGKTLYLLEVKSARS